MLGNCQFIGFISNYNLVQQIQFPKDLGQFYDNLSGLINILNG